MATIRENVAGTGYGNVYVDTLIRGGTAWDMSTGPIKVWFGDWNHVVAAEGAHGPRGDYLAFGHDWVEKEYEAFSYAASIYESVCGVKFVNANSVQDADIVWWKDDAGYDGKGYHESPSAGQTWGFFDPFETSWSFRLFGGDGLHTVLKTIGQGLGLSSPYNAGGEAFPGVDSPSSRGTHGLNQGVWTVMSDNPGWDGVSRNIAYGAQGELGAFDIAALQALYGKNMSTNTGDDVYELPTFSQALGVEGWACIWDAGGNDTIRSANVHTSVTIDLRAATLVNGDPNAGGFLSKESGVAGGFTIANGVVIENAVGGASGDTIYGNDAANVLQGRGGNDTIYGGAGGDTAVFSGNRGDYTITTVGEKTVVTDKVANRDGTDTLDSISILKFADSTSSTSQTENNGSQVNGTPANDTIYGAAGADNLFGEAGNDRIYGGLGNDRLTGGAGRDVFVFNTKANKSSNVDKILDFRTQDDSIYLDNKYFTKLGSGSLSKPKKFTKDMFVEGKKAKDAEDRVVYDKKSGALYYDADGTGVKAQVKFATIANKTKLTYQDFFVI